MTLQKQSQGSNYRISLRLDSEEDADIITWLKSLPDGQRSIEIRAALRKSIMQDQYDLGSNANTSDLDAIRSVVSEEIRKALKDKLFTSQTSNSPFESDPESKYGKKLDQMLGGFSRLKDNSD